MAKRKPLKCPAFSSAHDSVDQKKYHVLGRITEIGTTFKELKEEKMVPIISQFNLPF